MTRADKIRSMSDEELVQSICKNVVEYEAFETCVEVPITLIVDVAWNFQENLYDIIRRWLQQEVDDATN